LPFAICHYIETTGDFKILNEAIPYIKGRALNPGEESYYDLPIMGSKETAVSLYQHAVAAIRHGLKFGEHGLPLMGSGDWNDGMNLVGIEGSGESVWLGFFLYDVLQHFAKIAESLGDHNFSNLCLTESKKLNQNLELHAWDGKWYRRAYFDDGTPMGSENNKECRIDSIAQSWSILSNVADPVRAETALSSLYLYLVKPHDGIVKLLDPPFDKSKPNPGYIEGYLPGIRENGGQYTHAAIWAAMAFAKFGEIIQKEGTDKLDIDEKHSKLLDQRKAWQIFHMLNPINHGRSAEEIARYKIEPYVIAADIYSVAPHIGRGGWSWYTGSAGWFYRLITETLLGVRLKNGNQLYLTPVMPSDWNEFSIEYIYGKNKTKYQIKIERGIHQNTSENKNTIFLDDNALNTQFIPLIDDGQEHIVKLILI
jgi:cellobiose phosphorylase